MRFAAPGVARSRRCAASRSACVPPRPSRWSANPGRENRSSARASCAFCRAAAEITRGSILFADPRLGGDPVDLVRLPADGPAMRAIRGGQISIIFQEPMSSLSPLHTIGDQVSEALRLHRAMRRRRGQGTDHRHAAARRVSRCGARLAQLSVRAVRRVAAARDDRDGAGVPPGPADRRRADHRARRDDPGADPQADQRIAARARHGGAADHPRSRRRRQCRRRRSS